VKTRQAVKEVTPVGLTLHSQACNVLLMTNTGTRVLISLTGNKVHAASFEGQQDTGRTACAPMGRMGARAMRLRWTSQYEINCASCLKAMAK
jgi:hypothetical protein